MNELQAILNKPLLMQIISLLPAGEHVFLVGGTVRDALLNRESYDLDFATQSDALMMGKKVADRLGAAYYPLDVKRKVARLVLQPGSGNTGDAERPVRIDFSTYQGQDLIDDLRGRDFTINAMAVDVHQMDRLVDPLGGAEDLVGKRLRACSEDSFLKDPVRILRAVRFAVNLGLKIDPETARLMRQATGRLPGVSKERIRDELFRVLVQAHPGTAVRMLDMFGALEYILPEVVSLKGVEQSAPHIHDAWDHTLDVVMQMEKILDVVGENFDEDKASNLVMGMLSMRLGRFREELKQHLNKRLTPERPHRGLLFLSALYHDTGKLSTQKQDETGRIRFLEHEHVSSTLVVKRAQALKLSNQEVERLAKITEHHMRPGHLAEVGKLPSRRAIYRFFRDTGEAGVDICLLKLADVLATYGTTLPQEKWGQYLDTARELLNAWWDEHSSRIIPPTIIDGGMLMETLDLEPGPRIGRLLEAIREAQAAGEISNRDEAINLARRLVEQE